MTADADTPKDGTTLAIVKRERVDLPPRITSRIIAACQGTQQIVNELDAFAEAIGLEPPRGGTLMLRGRLWIEKVPPPEESKD